MSIMYAHALNYSQLDSSLVDTSVGFFNQDTFRNDDQQYYSTSTSSEMDTMFTNSQHLEVKQEEKEPFSSHYNGYSSYVSSSNHQMIYQTQQQNQGLPNHFDASFSAVNSLDSEDYITETDIGSSKNCSNNLIKHNSSPAEFFSNYSLHNDDVSINMPQIVENQEHKALQPNCIKSRNMGNDNGSPKYYMPSFTNDYWDATSTFGATKTTSNNAEIIFSTSNAIQTQDLDFGYQKLGLSHHLSLPSSCTKMTSMDKFFHIQGSVPCKIRAKRGFATHPRSIAERERRIRISARIKKLQDLFPNSDKQSSTADMLDEAVEYIKDLRKQLKILSDSKAKCSCTSN